MTSINSVFNHLCVRVTVVTGSNISNHFFFFQIRHYLSATDGSLTASTWKTQKGQKEERDQVSVNLSSDENNEDLNDS